MVRTAATYFIALVDDGVIHPTDPLVPERGVDDDMRVALLKCVDDLVLTETKKQFSNLSHLPNDQAALLAGVDVEATRLRKGLSDLLSHAAYMAIDDEMIEVFCRNAETVVNAIDHLAWMGDDENPESYG